MVLSAWLKVRLGATHRVRMTTMVLPRRPCDYSLCTVSGLDTGLKPWTNKDCAAGLELRCLNEHDQDQTQQPASEIQSD